MNLKTLRGMLRFYQLYEENHGDMSVSASGGKADIPDTLTNVRE